MKDNTASLCGKICLDRPAVALSFRDFSSFVFLTIMPIPCSPRHVSARGGRIIGKEVREWKSSGKKMWRKKPRYSSVYNKHNRHVRQDSDSEGHILRMDLLYFFDFPHSDLFKLIS